MSVGLAFLDPSLPCNRCGHQGDWHRTADGDCTYELLDVDSWVRCSCEGFMR